MTEREQACVVTTIGSVVGAIVAYLFFTERGNALRRQLLPALDDFERELSHFSGTVARTAGLASEGWKALNEVVGTPNASRTPRNVSPHQSIPF